MAVDRELPGPWLYEGKLYRPGDEEYVPAGLWAEVDIANGAAEPQAATKSKGPKDLLANQRPAAKTKKE